MKQLKLLTHQTPAIHSARGGLIKNSISSQCMHTFVNADMGNSYRDSEAFHPSDHEDVDVKDRITLFVVLMLLGAMALSYQWLTFTSLAIVIFCVSSLSVMFKRFRLSAVHIGTHTYNSEQKITKRY